MKKGRLWSVLLMLALLLTLAPALGGSAKAAAGTKVCIVTDTGYATLVELNQTVTLSNGGTALFRPNWSGKCLLVLENYVVNGSGVYTLDGSEYGIYCDGDLEIQIQGTCSISSTGGGTANNRYGIYASGSLTIQDSERGDNKLTVNMGKTASVSAAGIYCGGTLKIWEGQFGGTVIVNATGSGVTGGTSYGVYARDGVDA